MKWPVISKAKKPKLPGKSYRGWKEILAAESNHQCVYCAIPEDRFGGFWNFHVEHFRPKSRFKKLRDDYGNLFYACAICNVYKGSHWPGEPRPALDTKTFAEPSKHDYNSIFTANPNGHLDGTTLATEYMVERINLNRPQLIQERRLSLLKQRRVNCQTQITQLAAAAQTKMSPKVGRAMAKVLIVIGEVTALEAKLQAERPYTPKDISRND